MRTLNEASMASIDIATIRSHELTRTQDVVSTEEPLEILLEYGPSSLRRVKPLSVTMRTPGNDRELAAGFLLSEGIIRYEDELEEITEPSHSSTRLPAAETTQSILPETSGNRILVRLAPDVEVRDAILERNFYMTSSCGICGKASLLALQSVCPPRAAGTFEISSEILQSLPSRLREAQRGFQQTGSLHGAGLFSPTGDLLSCYEDVGRHNAVDKLVGFELLADRVPLRNHILLLSGRVSFELVQKALMAGISMIAAVGAPSSLAVETARHFDLGLVGFLSAERMNIYNGLSRITNISTHGEVS